MSRRSVSIYLRAVAGAEERAAIALRPSAIVSLFPNKDKGEFVAIYALGEFVAVLAEMDLFSIRDLDGFVPM